MKVTGFSRDAVDDIVKKISKDERRQLKYLGIKIGRYHIFLPKMLKPKAVALESYSEIS